MLAALVLQLCLAPVLPAAAGSFASLAGDETTSLAAAVRPAEPSKADPELVRLRDFVVGADRTLATRRDAAEVLLDKDTPAARAILLEVLSGPAPSEPILAVLEAIGGRESANPAFVEPLLALLRSDDDPTRRAAAAAFAAYQGNDKVRTRLGDLAGLPEAPVAARVAAAGALGRLMDKSSIEALVRLTSDTKPPVAAAAAEALADMTGLRDFGTSHVAWAEWWKKHEQDADAVFLANLLRRCREEARRHDAALDRLQARLIRHLTAVYEAADAKEKTRLALANLEDAVPQVRALGADQAAALAREVYGTGDGAARQTYTELIAAALKHVNDEDPAVRASASAAVAAWRETPATAVLLARLDVEKAPEVRAALAGALGGLKAVEAVPKLIPMLDTASEPEVLRAAGALGAIGEKGAPGAAAVEPAVRTLSRLARMAPQPAVREAACQALAKIAPPGAEEVLAGALEDAVASVRFSAAQGLGNLVKAGDKAIAALAARLQDENKGVRQAAAAALARLGGADAARKMADRLKVGAEAEPAVRNALWASVKALVDRSTSPDLAQDLGDRFFAREGTEEMQHAAAMYEAALAKFQPTARSGQAYQTLYEKLVDAYVAAGMPESAVPALRQLLAITPAENAVRVRELNQQMARIFLAREPYAEAVPYVVAAINGATTEERLPLLKALQTRAETLVKSGRNEQAMELLDAFDAAQADWGGGDVAASLKAIRDQARDTAVTQAIAKLQGPDDQAAATATLKKIGKPALGKLLDALQAAAEDKKAAVEARILAVLEAVFGRKDHGYSLQAPLEERLKKIEAWRESLVAPPAATASVTPAKPAANGAKGN
jgi:HEAT repeat protein